MMNRYPARSLWQQASRRVLIMLALAALIDAIASYSSFRWLSRQTLQQDVEISRNHLKSRLHERLEQDSVQTERLRSVVDFIRVLQGGDPVRWQRLHALLLARGETNQIAAALVSDRAGKIVFRYGQAGQTIGRDELKEAIATGWYAQRDRHSVFHAASAPLWLGDDGNGTLTLLWPMDNARLAALSTPSMELFLAKGPALWAASGGSAALGRVVAHQPEGELRVGGSDAYLLRLALDRDTTLLASVTNLSPATPLGVMLFGTAILLLLGLGIWLFLGRWMRDTTRGLSGIAQATERFAATHLLDAETESQLHAAEIRNDEVGHLAQAVRSLVTAAKKQEQIETEAYLKTLEMLEEGVVEIDRDGRIVQASAGWWRMTRSTALDRPLWEALDPDSARQLATEVMALFEGERTLINTRVRAALTGAWLECRLRSFEGKRGRVLRGVFNDVSEQVAHEKTRENALNEKVALLQEIHHRVKNNLQVIHSLLDLQAGRIDDAATKSLFLDAQARVRSIALIHQTLYQSKNFAVVDFSQYLQALLREFGAAHARVTLESALDPVMLELSDAIPCGLLVNELLTNACKHAFPDGRRGTVRITLTQGDNEVNLVVADDGVGMPPNAAAGDSLGMQLVRILTDQLGGKLEFSAPPGTRISVRFTPRTGTHPTFRAAQI